MHSGHSPVATPAAGSPKLAPAPDDAICDLWMIDHFGSTVLRCRCVDVAQDQLRLRVPLGYGVAEGQRYELRARKPDARETDARAAESGASARWATVIRTELRVTGSDDYIEVGVALDGGTPVLAAPRPRRADG